MDLCQIDLPPYFCYPYNVSYEVKIFIFSEKDYD